jgi:hypothetical protein
MELASPGLSLKGSGFCTNGTTEQADLQGPIVTGRSTLDRDNLKSGDGADPLRLFTPD